MTINFKALMPPLFLDFETQSLCDLKLHGLDRYLRDPSTRTSQFTYRLPGMRATELWEHGQPVPVAVCAHIAAGEPFVAHAAPFDHHVWNEILCREQPGLPRIAIEQTYCSAARARYNGLPGALADACDAMQLPIRKNVEAKKLMEREVFPYPDRTPVTHPELFAVLRDYGITDTDAMVGLWEATEPLPQRELEFFWLDMRINARGVGVDVEAAQAMEELRELAEAQLDYQVAVLTQGNVLAASEIAKIKTYARDFGTDITDGDREALKTLMARDGLPPELKELLALRLDASRAPKKPAAILRAHVGGRIRHSTVYHGALSGRSTARGAGNIQVLNVARPRPGRTAEQCEAYLEAALRRDFAFLAAPENGPVLAALADAQKPLFRATLPGHVLVGGDATGIEARFAPWLANDEAMLREIEQGIDGYKVEAAPLFGVTYETVTKDQRQVGKVVRLSLGFGGGEGAVENMEGNYGVHLTPEIRQVAVQNYRRARPAFERWWALLEYSVLIALDQPGRAVRMPIGRDFCTEAVFVRDDRALRMKLPSGRAISYHNARLHLEPGSNVPVAIYDKPEGYVEALTRTVLSNNMTQGLARDYFWEVMVDVDPVEPIVHHVYDDIEIELPAERAELRKAQLLQRMSIAPKWAPGLPLAAEGSIGLRWS